MAKIDGKKIIEYLKILGLSTENVLTQEELNRNKRKAAKYYHPDNKETGNREMFEKVMEAYDYCSENLDYVNEQIKAKFTINASDFSSPEEKEFYFTAMKVVACMKIFGFDPSIQIKRSALETQYNNLVILFRDILRDYKRLNIVKDAYTFLIANFDTANLIIASRFEYALYKKAKAQADEMKREQARREEEARLAREKLERERREKEAEKQRKLEERLKKEAHEAQIIYKNSLEEELDKIVFSKYSDKNKNALRVLINVYREKSSAIKNKLDADSNIRSFKNELHRIRTLIQEKISRRKLALYISIPTICALIISLSISIPLSVARNRKQATYDDAISLMISGRYDEAKNVFNTLDGFNSSNSKSNVCRGLSTLKKAKETNNQELLVEGIKTIVSSETVHISYKDTLSQTKSSSKQTYGDREENIWNSNFELYKPVHKGYTFTYWDISSFTYSENQTKLSLISNWNIAEYKIDYNLNGGINNDENPSKFTYFSKNIELKDPTKEGYTFKGWLNSYNRKVTTIYTSECYNVSLTATWEPNKYIVTFDANGGKVNIDSLLITFDSSYQLPTPTKNQSNFIGWYDENGIKWDMSGVMNVSHPTVLSARWDLISYQITYNLDGGVNNSSNPSTYTYEDEVILENPIKENYLFVGWLNNEKHFTKIEKHSVGDIELTAKWVEYIDSNKYDFEITDGKAIIKKYKGTETNVVVPYGVTEIRYRAFENKTSIRSVVIPGSVVQIGNNCFTGCSNMIDLTVPFVGSSYSNVNSLDYFFGRANNGYNNKVNLPNSLKKVTISGERETVVKSQCFYDCTYLENVVIGDNVCSLGRYSFGHSKALTSVTIPSSVSTFYDYVFYDCTALSNINYLGTKEQWLNITKGEYWNSSVPATYVHCVDGDCLL